MQTAVLCVVIILAVVIALTCAPGKKRRREGMGLDPTIRISVGGLAGPRWDYMGYKDNFPYHPTGYLGWRHYGYMTDGMEDAVPPEEMGMDRGRESYRRIDASAKKKSSSAGHRAHDRPMRPGYSLEGTDLASLELSRITPHYLETIDMTRATDSPYPSQGDLIYSMHYGYSGNQAQGYFDVPYDYQTEASSTVDVGPKYLM